MTSHRCNLKLFHWNANGISNYAHITQLEYLLEREHIHIASLNETHWKDHHKVYLRNYFIYRNDRISVNGGGVALLVHKSIKHKLLNVINTHSIENISIEVTLNHRKIIITSAYSPQYSSYFADDLCKLTSGKNVFFILGDLNAKHPFWNCNTPNTAGNVLYNLLHTNNFFLYNTNAPTFYPHQAGRSHSTLDVLLSNSSFYVNSHVLEYEVPSDHRPIVFQINSSSIDVVDTEQYNFKLTNWNLFRNYIEGKIGYILCNYNSTADLDQDITNFTNLILEARDFSTPKVNNNYNYRLSPDIIKLIKTRRVIKRKAQRTASLSESNLYKEYIKLISKIINERIWIERNNKWSNMLSKLAPGDKRFWQISKSLRGKGKKNIPRLLVQNNLLISKEEIANTLADTFATAHNITSNSYHSIDNRVNSKIISFNAERPITDDIVFTSLAELNSLIKSLKNSKSAGLDNISNILIKNLPPRAIQLLGNIFNNCIKLNYFPKAFKRAKVIPIHKPNKPKTDPTSYRPISLLSNIGKLYERIIQIRLNEFVSDNSILAAEQFGFRKEHSAVHQIYRIKNEIKGNKNSKRSTGLVLLDIEKAFDTVWHNGLIYKLLNYGTPKYLCSLIADFLSNRSYVVSVNGTMSALKGISAGVPQGSVLSPLLYAIYTSDFSFPKYIKTAYYADDTALITSSKLTKSLIKKMENSLAVCNRYFNKWKIKINPTKTQAIIFPYNNSPKRIPHRQINFGSNSIPILDCVNYLGVTLDKKLTFGKHIEATRAKCLKTLRALWPLLNKRSLLNPKNKGLIYKVIIRPSLCYACPVWYKAANSHIKKLQIIQNKCLKIIHNKNWRFSSNALHEETGYSFLRDFIHTLSNNFFIKNQHSPHPLIRNCQDSPTT